MSSIINTSYRQQYVVVSATSTEVVLRPVDDSLLQTYWREFLSGYIDIPEDAAIVIHVLGLPPEVVRLDAYVEYAVEYPQVEVTCNGVTVDVSDRLCVNHPNPETPGLYALDYSLSVGGESFTTVWRSWVSIEEPPVLRRIVTPWNRDNRTIADINRLVIEPRFTEALYEAGVPLYNFQQSNAPAAVGQFAILRYRDARAIVKGGQLFVSGPRLPVGTEVTIGGTAYVLKVPVMNPTFSSQDTYSEGDVVGYCGSSYYALEDIPIREYADPTDATHIVRGSVLPTDVATADGVRHPYWLLGELYAVDDLGLSDGEYELESLWASVDVNGYTFKMDLLRAFPVRHYWGVYDRKYFYDYAPGDLVAVVSDGVISLYQRNENPIDDRATEEAYRPGHYLNPNWTVVYSGSDGTLLSDPIIKPCTNATNTVVCKTCTARADAFRMYAHLVGIPQGLVDALGTKYSVLLWALLYRTRNTFPGLKVALNAIGLDVDNLRRAIPSVEYSGYHGSTPMEITDVYTEIGKVREIAMSVKADKVWTEGRDLSDDMGSDAPWIRYSSEGETPDTVFRYVDGVWVPFYTFVHTGSDTDASLYDYSVNNRYYRADVNLLSRLQDGSLVDMGDGCQWVEHSHFANLSLALARLLEYEIPIYIYFRLTIRLTTVGMAKLHGLSKGVILQDAWGGSVGLKLFPGKYFDFATVSVKSVYPKVLYTYEALGPDSADSEWMEYTDFAVMDGYRYFPFMGAVYLRIKYPDSTTYHEVDGLDSDGRSGRWVSLYTIGCLGDADSKGTGDYVATDGSGFKDATYMEDGTDLFLCKGLVGCTFRISTGSLSATGYAWQWQYIFNDPNWALDDTTPFADWESVTGLQFFGNWVGDVASYKSAVTRCTSPDLPGLTYAWGSEETPTLYIGGGVPHTLYLWDSFGNIRGLVQVPYAERMVLDATSSDYLLKLVFDA